MLDRYIMKYKLNNYFESGKAEMLKAAGDCILPLVTNLINSLICTDAVPDEWDLFYIINLYR